MGINMGFLNNIQRFLIYFAATCLVVTKLWLKMPKPFLVLFCFGLICRICYNNTPERRRKSKFNQISLLTVHFILTYFQVSQKPNTYWWNAIMSVSNTDVINSDHDLRCLLLAVVSEKLKPQLHHRLFEIIICILYTLDTVSLVFVFKGYSRTSPWLWQ